MYQNTIQVTFRLQIVEYSVGIILKIPNPLIVVVWHRVLLGLLQLTAVFDGCIEDRTTYYSSSISQARPCARGPLPARPTAATPSGRGEADGGRPLPLAAAAGVRVLAISHTLLPTGVGNGFGRVAKGRRQNDSSGISTILLIQFSPLALPYALSLAAFAH